MVPVRVFNHEHPEQYMDTWALLDTGATVSCMPHWISKYTGHDHERGAELSCDTYGGKSSEGRIHTVDLQVFPIIPGYSSIYPKLPANYNVPPVFSLKHIRVHVPDMPDRTTGTAVTSKAEEYMVLGKDGFLEKFLATFHYPAKKFSLVEPGVLTWRDRLAWHLLK